MIRYAVIVIALHYGLSCQSKFGTELGCETVETGLHAQAYCAVGISINQLVPSLLLCANNTPSSGCSFFYCRRYSFNEVPPQKPVWWMVY
jgi:hypothetical protein